MFEQEKNGQTQQVALISEQNSYNGISETQQINNVLVVHVKAWRMKGKKQKKTNLGYQDWLKYLYL